MESRNLHQHHNRRNRKTGSAGKGTKEDVDASTYCSVTGGDTSYGEYITNVNIHGINHDSGDDGGYADYTNVISDQLTPGESYSISVTFNTGGYSECASVAFDWEGDGTISDNTGTELGCCSTDGCTVSGTVSVP